MERRKFLTAVGGATAAMLAGCGGDGDSGTATPQGTVVQTIQLKGGITASFEPMTASVGTGAAVKWVNKTDSERAIRPDSNVQGAETWSWKESEATMSPNGGSVSFTFNQPGVYAFVDSLSTRFQNCGAVAVGDASVEDVSLPCSR